MNGFKKFHHHEIQQSFYEAQASLAIALIELERLAAF
jgi:hypothetical protein